MPDSLRYSASTLVERPGLRFLVLLTVWGLALTAVVTNATVMAALVVPFSRWQGEVAAWYLGAASLPVGVVPSCSGLDAMSLCVAATLAFPRTWRQRLAGAGVGLVLLLVVNLARIGSLAAAVDSAWFDVLHIVVWPAVLVVTTAGWVYAWIRFTDHSDGAPTTSPVSTRFAAWAAICLGVYIIVIPILGSLQVLDLFARDLASLVVSVLVLIGVEASVQGNLLVAGASPYLVTSECVTSPLMALYVAAVASAPIRAGARLTWGLAFAPVFVTLAVIRLLTVALPPLLFGSPVFVTHAFHQLVLAIVIVGVMAIRWRPGLRPFAVAGLVAAALALGLVTGVIAGVPYTQAIVDGLAWIGVPGAATLAMPAPSDLQGVITSLPAFQLALFVALVVVVWHRLSPRRTVGGAAVLVGVQLITLVGLAVSAVDVTSSAAVLALRGWALALPGVVVVGMLRSET